MIEGLATYEETQGTAFGRGRNPDVRMVLRMAALEDAFLREDAAVAGLDRWPAGQAAYFFGEGFLADLATRSGPAVLPDLARTHSGHVLPFLDEFTARKVTGSTFHALWTQWRLNSQAEFEQEAEEVRARGLTPSRALTTRGVRQSGPRFSPDGRLDRLHGPRPDALPFHPPREPRGWGRACGRQAQRRIVRGLDTGRPRAGLRRARELPALPRALGPAGVRPRHPTRAVDHARPARQRSGRLAGRAHDRLRAPGRRPQRPRPRRPRRDGPARPHAFGPGHAMERAALEPARRRVWWPRAGCPAAGSTSCSWIRSPARSRRSPGTGPRTWSRPGPRTAPTWSSAPTATASRTSTPRAWRTARSSASPTSSAAPSRRTSPRTGARSRSRATALAATTCR